MNCLQAVFASITFALLADGSIAQDCSNHGHWVSSTRQCNCDHGWWGQHCEKSGCKHGNWDSRHGCVCDHGWSGTLCDQQVCGDHGRWNGSQCVCPHGLTGAHCDISCKNGGSQSPDHPLRCHCGHGWSSITCDVHCINGRQDHTDQGGCHCINGWTGVSCDEMNCGDHGHWNGTQCACQGNYAGTKCEIHCQNDGTQSLHDPTSCHCSPRWAGRACDIDCNYGQHNQSDQTKCQCASGWTGAYCDQMDTTTTRTTTTTTTPKTTTATTTTMPTTPAVCGDHGHLNGHTCVCNQGYAGTYCEIHCLNGGLQSIPFPARCDCPTKFAGRTCDIECRNGHYDPHHPHTCHCDSGWTGTHCNHIVTTTTTATTTTTTAATTTTTTTPIPTTPTVHICSKVNGTGPFTHNNAKACPTADKGSHEALVLYHCSTVPHNTSSWQPGQHVTSKNCDDLSSKNAAVATFVNRQYIRDGGLSGLVVGCLTDGFQLMIQGCGFGVITLNITTGGSNLFDPSNYYTIQ